jgi:phosphotransferase system IIB component
MNKKFKNINATYLPIFGGLDNIKRIERQLNRVLVEVIDMSSVNIEDLKALNVGTQITGNIIKCSSKEMADELEKYKK